MKRIFPFLAIITIAGGSYFFVTEKKIQPTQTTIANPASIHCIANGGRLEIKNSSGGQEGHCIFSGGKSCEERAFFRKECSIKTNTTGHNLLTGKLIQEKPITSKPAPVAPKDNQDEPTLCTMDYTPVCAEVQIQCIKAPCPPIQQTFGNKCQMNANKLAKFLYEGECTQSQK